MNEVELTLYVSEPPLTVQHRLSHAKLLETTGVLEKPQPEMSIVRVSP